MAVHRHGIMKILKLVIFHDAVEISNDRHSLVKVKALCEQHGTKLVLEALQTIAQEYKEIARHDYNLVSCAVIYAEHVESKKKENSERLSNC
ncbi:MAG: hypothetical protein H0X31_24360 [Nostocaceae cyanobacterium]|nr:hypothetical protein [Nostocaceae cyanobacterium]